MAQTQSSSYFTGLRDDLTRLALDTARTRLIDSQTVNDEQNVPDRADLEAGFFSPTGTPQPAAAGLPLGDWLVVAGVIALGWFVVKQVA